MASRISRPTGEASPATLPASTIGPLSDVVLSRPTVAVSSSAARFTRARAVSSSCSYAATTVRANSASRTGGRLFTVRIGRSRTSAARYYLRQQQEIDALLEHLVALRVDATAGLGRRGGARP